MIENPKPVGEALPAVYFNGASVRGDTDGMTRITLCETRDGQSYARGVFIVTNATLQLLSELFAAVAAKQAHTTLSKEAPRHVQ